MTGEPDTYYHADDVVALYQGARAVEGVLVPEGMVAVNPDDLRILLDHAPGHSAARLRLGRAAASNPTTETPDA